ncbi:hypothetical protein EON82_20265 [bacterium]|nr:MAG: hypothetical protein EON82_20265 [bacterium]
MRLLLSAALAGIGSLVLAPQKEEAPNYTQHVAPVLRDHCVSCHQAGGSAPFSLATYGQAKQWSSMSASVIDSRRMPPWKPAEEGVFHDENRLSSEDLRILRAWEKGGRLKGPETPSAVTPVIEPAIEASDKILHPAKPYVVNAGAEDEYRYFVVRNPYSETKWLRCADLRPGNPRVVHHMTAFLDESGQAERVAKSADGQAGFASKNGGRFTPSAVLAFWAPGMTKRPFPEGTAMRLPPKAAIVLQVHYVSTGKAECDNWSLGLRLADAPPAKPIVTVLMERKDFKIPAGAAAHEIVEEIPVPRDVTLHALMPHAHALARGLKAEAILPDGTKRPLVTITDWDPAWQSMYWFKKPAQLPKGSKIRFAVTYDNSAANLRNPNQPPREVRHGEGAKDEMHLLGMLVTPD